jgi:hypothetical protein
METKENNANHQLVISHLTMRKAVGWLGMLLPFVLLIGNYCVNQADILNNSFWVNTSCYCNYANEGSYKTSISHYYYTSVGELFTGVLCAVALFLFCYKGHPKREGEKGLSDNATTTLAGIFALGVVIFPTSSDACIYDNIRTFMSSKITGWIHFAFAAAFFFMLAFMSIINFRRTEDMAMFGKKQFHNLYLICGIGMIACILLIALYNILKCKCCPETLLDKLHPTFILEAIALVLFGISWLTKGQVDFYYIPKKLKLIKRP